MNIVDLKRREFLKLFGAVWIHCLSFSTLCTAGTVFPGAAWEKVARPQDAGYSSEKLAQAREYSHGINTAAVVIVSGGHIVDEWGEVERKFKTHSIRKSFLSALYGRYVREGVIDLDKTMADLGIDDVPPLTEEEKQATVRDCLKARSGVYHTALYESSNMKKLKPARHSQKAGTHWYYNNWDFNVLGTIFERLTGNKIYEAIEEEIAQPIGMEHYTAADGEYVTGEESIHSAYPFRITARDLARFGWLMLNKGNWKGAQVIDADWVEESTRYHSDASLYSRSGYGYLWWVARDFNKYPSIPGVALPDGTFIARGSGGHFVLVMPEYDLVIVHRVNTDVRGTRVSREDQGRLVQLILNAKLD